jgi:hypothetical protein
MLQASGLRSPEKERSPREKSRSGHCRIKRATGTPMLVRQISGA